jgi:endonuclease/exonuclease/phosphatase family metal-dependent hydrolase
MDNTTVISWNVRGLNDRARRDTVRTLVHDIHPSIVCLQETKLAVIPQHLVFAMLGISFADFGYLPASNTIRWHLDCGKGGRRLHIRRAGGLLLPHGKSAAGRPGSEC